MRRSTLWMCALLGIATSGCKQINDQYAKLKDQYAKIKQTIEAKIAQRRGRAPTPPPPATPQTPTPAKPTPTKPAAPTAGPAGPASRPPASQAPERPRATRDLPYESPDTGTIAPGMSERDVYARWGPPIAVRRQGDMTFLYFRNGCEYTCGTEDVVFLQNGHVVDAVLRWPGHGYSGQSSSPAATQPHPRHGGDTLAVKQPSTP